MQKILLNPVVVGIAKKILISVVVDVGTKAALKLAKKMQEF